MFDIIKLSFCTFVHLETYTKNNTKIHPMSRTRYVRFFVSEEQYQEIILNAKLVGFKSAAPYVRHLALCHEIRIERFIVENNKLLKQLLAVQNERTS